MRRFTKRTFLVYLLGFIIARAMFNEMNPLSIGYFTAAYLTNAGAGMSLIVVLLGIASVMEPTQILRYALTMVASLIFMESPLFKNKMTSRMVLSIFPSIMLLLFSLLEASASGNFADSAVLAFLEAIIAVVASGIFQIALIYLQQVSKDYRMNNEQMISIAAMVAVVIYAIPEFSMEFISPLKSVVYFIVLFFTYKFGVGQGAITGAVCGLAIGLRGNSVSEIGLYTVMGIIPAVFREMGRFPTAIIYLLTAVLMGTINSEMELNTAEIGALCSAVILFLLIPSSLSYKMDAVGGTGKQEQLATINLRKIAKARMRVFSDSFLKLSKTLDVITEKQTKLEQQEVSRIFEDISEKLCKNCSKIDQCWEQKFQKTYQAACSMFELAEKKGMIEKDDIPLEFLDDCISIDEFIAETNRGFEIAKLNQIWHSRISESREVIAEQLKKVSDVIQEVTGEIYETTQGFVAEEEKIIRAMRSAHILVKDITVFEQAEKRKEVHFSAASQGGRCITAKEAAAVISDTLGVKMKVSETSKSVISKEYENFCFVTDTKFKLITGVARAKKEQVSGDNFSLLKLENGEYMLALSDGMGTGKEAGEESETVMSLLEQMIEAGFKAETAIRLINSSLVLKSEKQTFSTIDLSIVNLFTGICEFIKIGAAAAFIKRDHWVETITSTTLPIGMLKSVDYDTVTKKLYEGDILIMVTDGVLDCIEEENKEAYMEQLILGLKSNNPQEIANKILEKTLAKTSFVPNDDMTVITAGMWLK